MADNALLADTSSYANPNNKLLSVASNDPSQQIQNANGMMALQRQGVSLSQQQIELGKQKLGVVNGVLSAIGADPTPENVQARINDALNSGAIDPGTAQQGLQEFAAAGSDPTAIKRLAFRHMATNMTIEQQLTSMGMGAPSYVSNGQQQVPVTPKSGLNPSINPAGGAPIQMQMSPSDAASPVAAPPDPVTGATRLQSKAAFAAGQGLPGGATGGGAAVDPFGRIAYPGRAVPAAPSSAPAAAQPAPPAGSPPAPSTQPPSAGPMVSGLPPGQNTTADANAAASVAAGQKLQAAADQVPNLKTTIANMEDKLKNIDTGPNAAKINTLKAGANVIAGAVGLPDSARFNPQSIASMEDFRNGSVKLAQQQFQQLGGTGTDGQFASASGDVPNDNLSKLGNQQILALNKGLADAISVKNSAWQNWQKQNPTGQNATYGAFSNDWNQTFSPRAFQLNYLSPQDRADMIKNMSPQELAQVKSAYNTAVTRGWITVPGSK